MSDTQAAMREFRFLDEKRKTNGLTQVEEQRWQELGSALGIDLSAAMQPTGYYGPDGLWYQYPPGYDPQAAWAMWQQQQQQQQQYYPPQQPYYDPNTGAYYPPQQGYEQQGYPQQQQGYYDPNTGAYYPPEAYQQQAMDPSQMMQHQAHEPLAPPVPTETTPPGWGDPAVAAQEWAEQPSTQPAWSVPAPPPAPAPSTGSVPVFVPPSATLKAKPAAAAAPASDEVMEISDEEVEEISGAVPAMQPPVPAPSSSPPIIRMGLDSVDALRGALLEDMVAPELPMVTSGPDGLMSNTAITQLEAATAQHVSGEYQVPAAAVEASPEPVFNEGWRQEFEAAPATSPSLRIPRDAAAPEPLEPPPSLDATLAASSPLELKAPITAIQAPSATIAALQASERAAEAAAASPAGATVKVPAFVPPSSAPQPMVSLDAEVSSTETTQVTAFPPQLADHDPAPTAADLSPPLEAIPPPDPTPPAFDPGGPAMSPPVPTAPEPTPLAFAPEPSAPTLEVAMPALDVAAPLAEPAPAPLLELSAEPLLASPEPSVPAPLLAELEPVPAPAAIEEVPASAPLLEVSAEPILASPEPSAPTPLLAELAPVPVEEAPAPLLEPEAAAPLIEAAPVALEAPLAVPEPKPAPLAPMPALAVEPELVPRPSVPLPIVEMPVEYASAPPPEPPPSLPSVVISPELLSGELVSAPSPSASEAGWFSASAPAPIPAPPPPLEAAPGETKVLRAFPSPVPAPPPAAPPAAATEQLPWGTPETEPLRRDASEWPSTDALPSFAVENPPPPGDDWDTKTPALAVSPPGAASVFDQLALPPESAPRIPDLTPPAMPPPAAAAPAVEASPFGRSFEAEPELAAKPDTSAFGSGWSNEPEEPAGPLLNATVEPELAGQANEPIELAGPGAFVPPKAAEPGPTESLDVDVGEFVVENVSVAELATNVRSDPGPRVEEAAPVELATNSDFIGQAAAAVAAEPVALQGEEDGDVIQGTVLEDDPPPTGESWGIAVTQPSAPPPPVAPMRAPAPPPAPPPAAAPPVHVAPVAAASRPPPLAEPPAPRSSVPSGPVAPQIAPAATQQQQAPVSVPGEHRVILHTIEGQVKRGAIKDVKLGDPQLQLKVANGGTELLPKERVKALFFMLAPGTRAPAIEGNKVRVTFRDGRQVAGFSKDHKAATAGFFVIPADNRTNTERIFIFRHAIQSISVEA